MWGILLVPASSLPNSLLKQVQEAAQVDVQSRNKMTVSFSKMHLQSLRAILVVSGFLRDGGKRHSSPIRLMTSIVVPNLTTGKTSRYPKGNDMASSPSCE